MPNEQHRERHQGGAQTLAQTVFDKDKAAPIVDALKRYRRAINSSTNGQALRCTATPATGPTTTAISRCAQNR